MLKHKLQRYINDIVEVLCCFQQVSRVLIVHGETGGDFYLNVFYGWPAAREAGAYPGMEVRMMNININKIIK
jgi:hypothetical protein